MTRLAFAIAPLLVLPAVDGTIIHVPSEAQTIQIAILKAQPFDTIIIAPGTYSEAINYMGKVIIVQSENPNDPATVANTIIDPGGLGVVVTFAGTEGAVHSALDGLTITGGTKGIDGNGTTASIRNCVVRDNSSYGILGADGDISTCEIRDNDNRGLYFCGGTIRHCTIERNSGGLLDCDGTIIECVVTRSMTGAGVQNCDGEFLRCVISENATYGAQNSDASFRQCIVSGNGQTDSTIVTGQSLRIPL